MNTANHPNHREPHHILGNFVFPASGTSSHHGSLGEGNWFPSFREPVPAVFPPFMGEQGTGVREANQTVVPAQEGV